MILGILLTLGLTSRDLDGATTAAPGLHLGLTSETTRNLDRTSHGVGGRGLAGGHNHVAAGGRVALAHQDLDIPAGPAGRRPGAEKD